MNSPAIITEGVRITGLDALNFVEEFWFSWEAECLPRNENHWTPSMVMSAMIRFKKRAASEGRKFAVWIELAE